MKILSKVPPAGRGRSPSPPASACARGAPRVRCAPQHAGHASLLSSSKILACGGGCPGATLKNARQAALVRRMIGGLPLTIRHRVTHASRPIGTWQRQDALEGDSLIRPGGDRFQTSRVSLARSLILFRKRLRPDLSERNPAPLRCQHQELGWSSFFEITETTDDRA